MSLKAEDAKFGEDAWVYCTQHLRPHSVGWCTVDVRDKVLLKAKNYADAVKECQDMGLTIYQHEGIK